MSAPSIESSAESYNQKLTSVAQWSLRALFGALAVISLDTISVKSDGFFDTTRMNAISRWGFGAGIDKYGIYAIHAENCFTLAEYESLGVKDVLSHWVYAHKIITLPDWVSGNPERARDSDYAYKKDCNSELFPRVDTRSIFDSFE